jgi:hypothetical protein
VVGNQLKLVPANLKRIAEGTYQGLYLRQERMTPKMKLTTQQILNCPYQGLTRRLYLESKAIELMAFYFEQVLSDPSLPNEIKNLKQGDVERIHWGEIF